MYHTITTFHMLGDLHALFPLFSRTTLWVETNSFFNIIEETRLSEVTCLQVMQQENKAKQITPGWTCNYSPFLCSIQCYYCLSLLLFSEARWTCSDLNSKQFCIIRGRFQHMTMKFSPVLSLNSYSLPFACTPLMIRDLLLSYSSVLA